MCWKFLFFNKKSVSNSSLRNPYTKMKDLWNNDLLFLPKIRLDFSTKNVLLPAMHVHMEKTVKLVFSTLLLISFLIFTFCTPLTQLLLLDYMLISSQTEQCYFYKKLISFTNGIFDMQTSLAIPFTILKTKNHAYFIFNIALTWLLNVHVASVLNMLKKIIMLSVVISVTYGYI